MSKKLFKRLLFLILILLISPNLTVFSNNSAIQNYYSFNIIQSIETERFEGYNLFVFERKSSSDYVVINRTLVIFDLDSNVYFKRELDTEGPLANFAAEFINSTTILYGEGNGANLWNIYTNDTTTLGVYGHHDYEMNYANNTYFTLNCYVVEINGTEYLFDKIVEYDQNAEIIWEKDTMDFVDISQWCPFSDMESGIADITHSNSVFYDEDDDSIYLNMRNTNTFYKIDHKTGKIIWALGEYGDFVMYDLQGREKDILFYHGHALKKIANNTFIYFDNDQHNQENVRNLKSRIIEIQVNERERSAKIIWEWNSTREYHSGWWGDADRLPNENRLGTFGTMDHGSSNSTGARLVEINSEGDIVWEMKFPKDGDIGHGVYRMERFRFSPIIDINTTYWIKSGKEVIIEWQSFYNFRNKYTNVGEYKLFFENELKDENSFTFERYWQPTNFEHNLGFLDDGNYNLTIVLEDEVNHQTIQQINLTISETPPGITTETSGFVILSICSTITLIVVSIRKKSYS